MSAKQGDLFPAEDQNYVSTLAVHRDVVAICEKCHREIQIVKYNPMTKEVQSEYRSAEGRCYDCTFPRRG